MKTMEKQDTMLGLHQFTVYEGDVEYRTDEESGLLVPTNPIVFESPVVKNIIVVNGKNLAMDRLFGLGADAAIGHIGVGNGVTAPVDTQTALVGASVLIKVADAGTSRTNQTVTIKATFATGEANFTWEEAGLFNGTVNASSRMFNRVKIGPFAKTTAVSIVYTTTVTQA